MAATVIELHGIRLTLIDMLVAATLDKGALDRLLGCMRDLRWVAISSFAAVDAEVFHHLIVEHSVTLGLF